MRTVLVALMLLTFTPVLASIALIAALFRVPNRRGGVYDWAEHAFARWACRAAGIRIVVHDGEERSRQDPRIYMMNHVSWFDVLAVAAVLPRYTFIAKAELERIPLFGPAARAAGLVFIERQNRKAAFESYQEAAKQVQQGMSVVIAPEGTRGYEYELRPFKKGPFVFAISAGVPIVPTIVYGQIEVQRKGSMRVSPGTVHIHFLEPVPTHGYTYDRRDELMRTVWHRMDDAMLRLYGFSSSQAEIAGEGAGDIRTSFL